MEVFTDTELVNYNQQFILKLRDTYLNNRKLFNELKDFLPGNFTINKRYSLDLVDFNKKGLSLSPEMQALKENGGKYLETISSQYLLNILKEKVNYFNKENDSYGICNTIEQIQLFEKSTYLMGNKVILDDALFLNTKVEFQDMAGVGKTILSIFPDISISNNYWLRFYNLTKQEKNIIKLLAESTSVKRVSDIICLSEHTVHTHKRNIYKKLDINKLSELVKVSLMLDIIYE